MPANLSPEYKAAEAAFRTAREPRERLDRLRDMLRTIPKHKGTDHLQADIKRRIKELAEEIEAPKKGPARGAPSHVVRPEGAAQLALLGPPNTGKSALHVRLTASHAHVAEYPFTTQEPQAGMMTHEDVHFELVDLPAVSPEHPVPWLATTLQTADGCLLVVDLTESSCVEQIQALHAVLRGRRVTLVADWKSPTVAGVPEEGDPFALRLPTLMLLNKVDLIPDVNVELQVFRELTGLDYPALAVSASSGQGIAELGPWLFEHLGIVRIYTKTPGRPAERDKPFTLRRGQTIEDVARLVHKDLAHTLKYARVWGKSGFGGQQVGREHPIADGDVVELHT